MHIVHPFQGHIVRSTTYHFAVLKNEVQLGCKDFLKRII